MTAKELKGLSRHDLLELLLTQTKKCEALQAQLAQAQAKLESREILIADSGSLAEAAMQMNGLFQAADQAASQYLSNVMRICAEYELKCATMEQETKERCEDKLRDAQFQVQGIWAEVYQKMEQMGINEDNITELMKRRG